MVLIPKNSKNTPLLPPPHDTYNLSKKFSADYHIMIIKYLKYVHNI